MNDTREKSPLAEQIPPATLPGVGARAAPSKVGEKRPNHYHVGLLSRLKAWNGLCTIEVLHTMPS